MKPRSFFLFLYVAVSCQQLWSMDSDSGCSSNNSQLNDLLNNWKKADESFYRANKSLKKAIINCDKALEDFRKGLNIAGGSLGKAGGNIDEAIDKYREAGENPGNRRRKCMDKFKDSVEEGARHLEKAISNLQNGRENLERASEIQSKAIKVFCESAKNRAQKAEYLIIYVANNPRQIIIDKPKINFAKSGKDIPCDLKAFRRALLMCCGNHKKSVCKAALLHIASAFLTPESQASVFEKE